MPAILPQRAALSDAAAARDVTPVRDSTRPGLLARLARAFGVLALLAAVAVFAAAAARPLAAWAAHGHAALMFPYPLNYGEGPLLDQAARAAVGEPLYAVPGAYTAGGPARYTITNYPPVYMLVQAPFVAAFGPSFAYARALSLVSAVVAAAAVAGLAAALTRDRLAGVLAGVLAFTVPYVAFWSSLGRIDTLALALSLCGAAVAVAWPHRAAAVVIAAALCALAAYTRQTYVLAAPMAVFAYLWGGRWRYNALLFAIAFGVLGTGALAVLVAVTRGGFLFHIVTANVNALDDRLITVYAAELAAYLPLMLAAGLFVIGAGWALPVRDTRVRGSRVRGSRVLDTRVRDTPGSRLRRPAAWWFAAPYLLGALVSALSIAKIGSDVNYLYELVFGLALASAVITAALAQTAVLARVPVFQAVWIALLAAQIAGMTTLSTDKYLRINADRIAQEPGIAALAAEVAAEPGLILADEYLGLLPLAGRRIVFQPFEMGQLAAAGLWDDAPLADAIRAGEYPLLLLYQPFSNPGLRFERWTRPLLAAINDAYRPAGNLAETTVYRLAE
jgi:hypothetical protein